MGVTAAERAVVGWAGWPFHRATLINLRHAQATMDTLISVGTLAALGWSAYAMFTGAAGEIGFHHDFELRLARHDGTANIYLEAAVGITTFVLAGRYAELRAKRRSGAALRALLELGARDVAVLRTVPNGGSGSIRCWSAIGSWSVRREDRNRRNDRLRLSALDTSMITGESMPVEVGPGAAVVGGTINTSGRLVVEATRVGATPAGPDRPTGRGRAGRQGGCPAARTRSPRSSCRS